MGDRAWKRQADMKPAEFDDVHVRKGTALLELTETKADATAKVPCTMDQLVALARLATNRLP